MRLKPVHLKVHKPFCHPQGWSRLTFLRYRRIRDRFVRILRELLLTVEGDILFVIPVGRS
jgi:hypothetical protein